MEQGFIWGWDSANSRWVQVRADSEGRLIIDPSNLFEDTPSNGETGKGPTSNWAYDHKNNASVHHSRYTNEEAQDTVANMLNAKNSISLTYDDQNDTLDIGEIHSTKTNNPHNTGFSNLDDYNVNDENITLATSQYREDMLKMVDTHYSPERVIRFHPISGGYRMEVDNLNYQFLSSGKIEIETGNDTDVYETVATQTWAKNNNIGHSELVNIGGDDHHNDPGVHGRKYAAKLETTSLDENQIFDFLKSYIPNNGNIIMVHGGIADGDYIGVPTWAERVSSTEIELHWTWQDTTTQYAENTYNTLVDGSGDHVFDDACLMI